MSVTRLGQVHVSNLPSQHADPARKVRSLVFHPARCALLALLVIALAAGAGAAPQAPPEDLKVEAPAIPTSVKWLQAPPTTLEKLRGKVVLVDFWEYTCVNCIRTFPYLKKWHEKYKDQGLVILGVHTPEFDFAKAEHNVARAAKQFGLGYPILVDSDYAVWRSYGNRYWPAKYLIDKDGFVRYFHFGEGGYGDTETKIQALLKEANPQIQLPPITEPLRGTDKPGAVCYPVTPELYAGFERGGYANTLANEEGYQPGKSPTYKDPGSWEDGRIYLQGKWTNTSEAFISSRSQKNPADYLAIKYHALEVNSVIRPEKGKPARVWIYQNNKPVPRADKGDDLAYDSLGRSYITVSQPRMYNLIKNSKFGQHTLKMATADAGVGIYSFTFVSCELPGEARPKLP